MKRPALFRRERNPCLCILKLILVSWGGSLIAADPVITFEEAWRQVRLANPELAAAHIATDRREARRKATRSLNAPQVEIAGRWTVIDEPILIDLEPIRSALLSLHPAVPESAIPSFVQPVQDERFLAAQLHGVWPVYAGGRIRAAQRAASAAVDESLAGGHVTADQLFSELVRRFYGAQLARVVLSMRQGALADLTRHRQHARLLESEGQIARAERLHAEVARDEAERECMRAESHVAIAQVALSRLWGGRGSVIPDSPLFLISEPLPPLERFLNAVPAHHPALDVLDAVRDQAEAGVAVEKGSFLPEVYLFGTVELVRPDLTLLEPDWAVGVGMRFVVMDRIGRMQRLRAAKLQVRRLELLTRDIQDKLSLLVEKSYREADLARRQFASLASSLELARENLRVREMAFREGQGTSLDVVDARLTLVHAETARAVATAEFAIALAQLLEACGHSDRFLEYADRATERISP